MSLRQDYKSPIALTSAKPHLPLSLTAVIAAVGVVVVFAIGRDGQAGISAAQAKAEDDWRHNIPLIVPALHTSTKSNAGTMTPVRLVVARGDNLDQLFASNGLSRNDLHNLLRLPDIKAQLVKLFPGETIEVLQNQGKLMQLTRVTTDSKRMARRMVITRDDKDNFSAHFTEIPLERRVDQASGVVENSLFLAGKEAGLSDRTIMNLAGVLAWDVDFLQDIRPGDQFSVVYEEQYRDGQLINDGDIVAAEYINQGRTYRVVRYTTPEGEVGYYTPEGRSVKRAFLRAPLPFTPRVTSNFNPRRLHPIFKTSRPHRGVDYGAPKGTPVLAAGDGKIIERGWQSGYGNVVILQHGGNVTTLYAHLSKFDSDFKLNSRVKQGQTIAYVGSTGYATGPHLHFEYRINGVHQNPRTVKLPAAEPVPEKLKRDFHQQIAPLVVQLDGMIKPTLLAAL